MLTDAMTDEGISYPVSMSFPFHYGMNTYSNFIVSSNGWLNLGANLSQPYYGNDLASLNIRPLIAPLWDDLGMQNGAVQYWNFGVAPHRYCVVQWSAAHWNYQATNEYSLQARMHETGQIDFVYGPHSGVPGTTASACIGINMIPGGSGNYYSVYPGYPAHVSSTNQTQSIATAIPEGTLYIFAPKHNVTTDASIVNLYGPLYPHKDEPVIYNITVGNAGVSNLGVTNYDIQLMRGNTVLATRSVNATLPGLYINETIPWTPDSTGVQQIYARIDLPADMDSTNNVSLPLNLNVLPPVSNADTALLPAPLQLGIFPNPMRQSGTISYVLKQSEPMELAVYDLKGRKVSSLRQQYQAAGEHSIAWDVRSDEGKALANGIYFLRLTAGDQSTTRKLMVLDAN